VIDAARLPRWLLDLYVRDLRELAAAGDAEAAARLEELLDSSR
jgi:hypothetical protein